MTSKQLDKTAKQLDTADNQADTTDNHLDISTCSGTMENFGELRSFIEGIEDKRGALISVLHKAQHLYGYLSDEVIIYISEQMGIPTSKIYGVISFYSYFTTTQRGKNVVNVCLGTACFVRGADAIMKAFEKELNIHAGETDESMDFTLSGLRCIGACGLAPVVMVNDKVYGRVEVGQVKKIIEEYKDEKAHE